MPHYYYPAEEIRVNSYWYRFLVPVDSQPATLQRLQWRSRGRHQPGSGPYINRIVKGGIGHGVSSDFPYDREVFAEGIVTSDYFPYPNNPLTDGWFVRVITTGTMIVAWTFKDPEGTHPVSPQYDHWNVKVQFWTFSATFNSTATNMKVYRGDISRRWYSYFGDFHDSWEAARNFALRVATNPWSYITPPPTTVYMYNGRPFTLDGVTWEAPRFTSSLGSLVSTDVDTSLLPNWAQAGLANAYVDACDKLPHLNGMNNIANIIQTATLLRDLLKGGVTELGKLKDVWLGWRYEYSTTKMDIEEGAALTFRLLELTKLVGSKTLKSNGIFHSGSWTYRASIGVQFDVLSEIQSFAERWGIQLDGYNAWDMVPYSFVVDWFLHISDILERWDSQKYALKVPVDTCWLSMQTEFVNEFGCPEVFYRRFSGRPNIRVADLDWMSRSPAAVTVVKRAVDVVCLL